MGSNNDNDSASSYHEPTLQEQFEEEFDDQEKLREASKSAEVQIRQICIDEDECRRDDDFHLQQRASIRVHGTFFWNCPDVASNHSFPLLAVLILFGVS